MNYTVKARSSRTEEGEIEVGGNKINFGVSKQNNLPSPADLLISAFAACCLKNIERFSEFMHYTYSHAEISVEAVRKDKPPMIEKISFSITVFTQEDKINVDLLLRNLHKFGTIYNTLNAVCEIEGDIIIQNA